MQLAFLSSGPRPGPWARVRPGSPAAPWAAASVGGPGSGGVPARRSGRDERTFDRAAWQCDVHPMHRTSGAASPNDNGSEVRP